MVTTLFAEAMVFLFFILLAIYGVPLGLLAAGALIGRLGFAVTGSLDCLVGAGLTQSELAGERFSKEYVSQIERGKTRPTRETIDWLAKRFQDQTGIDLRKDRMALQRLKEAAEKAKMELSTVTETDINLPFITADASGPKHLNVTLSRAKMEQICDALFERCYQPFRNCLKDAGINPKLIANSARRYGYRLDTPPRQVQLTWVKDNGRPLRRSQSRKLLS